MIKVAIYCRLSDEDKNKRNALDESESIQNQKSMLVSYALERGWELYSLYCDEDYSGADSKRPEFNRMLRDAELGKFHVVLCKTQSRFTRDMELVEKYIHGKFIEWNIRFVSVVDNADTCVKSNKKARQINGLINEWYLEDASENIRAVFDDKRKKGRHIGSFATYGYEKNPKDRGRFVVDPEAAENVGRIFHMYLKGSSTAEIVRCLNNEGIPSPTKYKHEKGQKIPSNTKTGLWSRDSVLKILKNQMYIGNMVQGYTRKASYKSEKLMAIPKEQRIIVQNTHEPIIDEGMFWEVQKMLTERRRSTTHNGRPHLLAGKVRCLDCGSTMYKKSYTGEEGRTYLRCKLSAIVDRGCTPHSVSLKSLLFAAAERIREYILSYGNFEEAAESLLKVLDNSNRLKPLQNELKRAETSLEQQNKLLKSLYTDRFNGAITEGQFRILWDGASSEQERLEKRVLAIRERVAESESLECTRDIADRIIAKYKTLESLDTLVVREFIDYIEVGERCRDTKTQLLVIHWLF